MSPEDNHGRYLPFFISFAVALLVRAIYLFELSDTPFFAHPIIDAASYMKQAQQMARGDWLLEYPPIGGGVYAQAPLYPLFLGILLKVFGGSFCQDSFCQTNFFLLRGAGLLLGAVTAGIVAETARRIFGYREALIAGLIFAMYPTFIFFEAELLSPALSNFLNSIAILIIVSARGASMRWLLAGLVLGVSMCARGEAFALWGAAAFLAVLSRELSWFKRLAAVGLLAAGMLLPNSLVFLRNHVVTGQTAYVYGSGLSFYLGNNPDYEKTVGIRPGREWDRLQSEPTRFGSNTESEKTEYFLTKSFKWILDSPAAYAGLIGKKFMQLINGHEIMRNQDIYLFREDSLVLKALLWERLISFPFGLLLPLAMMGIIICLKSFREKKRILLFLAASTVFYSLFMIMFFPASRYRLPMVMLLIFFAAPAISRGIGYLRQSGKARALVSLLLFFGLMIVCNLGSYRIDASGPGEKEYNLANAYQSAGKLDKALELYFAAVKVRPTDPALRCNMGRIYLKKNDAVNALKLFKEATVLDPQYPDAHMFKGVAELNMGKVDQAMESFGKVMRLRPRMPQPYRAIAGVYLKRGEPLKAEQALKKAIERDPFNSKNHTYLAFSLLEQNKIHEAKISLEKALEIDPADKQANDLLTELNL